MAEQLKELLDLNQIAELLDPQAAIYLVTMLVVFYLGKKVHDWLTSFNLNEQLTKEDNKAIAVSFGGYLLGLGIILWGILSSDSVIAPTGNEKRDLLADLLNTVIWSLIGIVLLQLARYINDKVLFSQFNNTKELVTDRNIGTGAVECGSFIGSALIIRAALSGEEEVAFLVSLLLTVIFFFAGQFAFLIFGKFYQFVSRFDLHKEIEKDTGWDLIFSTD